MKNLTHIVMVCLSALAGAGGWLGVQRLAWRRATTPAFHPTQDVDYTNLTVEELAMRFRCGDIYLPAGGEGDAHAQAFDELLRRRVIRAGITRAETALFLGDPFNAMPGSLPPHESLDRFEYDYLCGSVILHFGAGRLSQIVRTGCGHRARGETLLC